MRSKIEANEYKDYILGFIFYKHLSDKLVRFAKEEDFSDEDLRALSEEDSETVDVGRQSQSSTGSEAILAINPSNGSQSALLQTLKQGKSDYAREQY